MRIRGDHARALQSFLRALEVTRPGRHHVWPRAAEQAIYTLLVLGREKESLTRGTEWNESWERYQLVGGVGVALAAAEAKTGDYERGIRRLLAIIEDWRGRDIRGVQLGRAYEVGARMAAAAADHERFAECEACCREEYTWGQTPALVGKYANLRDAGKHAEMGFGAGQAAATSAEEIGTLEREVSDELASLDDSGRLATRALELLVEMSKAQGGFLFWTAGRAPQLIAALGQVPAGMADFVSDYLSAEMPDAQTMTVDIESVESTFLAGGVAYVPLVLREIEGDEERVLGAAVLKAGEDPLAPVSPGCLKVINEALRQSGPLA